MEKVNVFVIVLVFSLLVSGCATQRGWRYSAESKKSRVPLVDMSVAVVPFKDDRPDKNKNALMMYLIRSCHLVGAIILRLRAAVLN